MFVTKLKKEESLGRNLLLFLKNSNFLKLVSFLLVSCFLATSYFISFKESYSFAWLSVFAFGLFLTAVIKRFGLFIYLGSVCVMAVSGFFLEPSENLLTICLIVASLFICGISLRLFVDNVYEVIEDGIKDVKNTLIESKEEIQKLCFNNKKLVSRSEILDLQVKDFKKLLNQLQETLELKDKKLTLAFDEVVRVSEQKEEWFMEIFATRKLAEEKIKQRDVAVAQREQDLEKVVEYQNRNIVLEEQCIQLKLTNSALVKNGVVLRQELIELKRDIEKLEKLDKEKTAYNNGYCENLIQNFEVEKVVISENLESIKAKLSLLEIEKQEVEAKLFSLQDGFEFYKERYEKAVVCSNNVVVNQELASSYDTLEREHTRVKAMYKQLKNQFDEKARVLTETRKELFSIQTSQNVLEKTLKERDFSSNNFCSEQAQNIIKDCCFEVETLEKEIIQLEELVSHILRQ